LDIKLLQESKSNAWEEIKSKLFSSMVRDKSLLELKLALTTLLTLLMDGKEDSIPFTVLNICNKANDQRKRCFLYSYQVTLHVTGPTDISAKLFTKIILKNVN